jgi:4-amino-4-deoxy-L-arabinose transferase-like glycosyltransferase
MNKKVLVVISLVVFLGSMIRFRDITTNPPNLNTDEAAIGYNAYSILRTGRDEYGQFLPLAFRSFDDYKPPLYIYLTVPSVAVFGLNEFAVRFPSAFLGVLAVVITGFLTKRLLGNWTVGLLASFLLAISPWHVQFTRTAYETGSNAFFTSLGLLLFLKGLEKKWFLVGAGIIFGLQTYLYQASKVFVPLLIISIFIIYFRRINWRQIFLFIIPFILLLVPLINQSFSSTGLLRVRGTSVFQDPKAVERRETYERADWLNNDNKSVRLFHQKSMTYFQDILVGYLSHFRPDFLLASRTDPKVAYAPEAGLIPLWTAPFLLIGFSLLFRRKDKTSALLLIAWILISPIPASITTGLPSSIRTAIFLPSWQIVTAWGMWEVLRVIKERYKNLYPPFIIMVIIAATYLLAFYAHMLFLHAPEIHARTWYASYKKFVTDSLTLAPQYSKVIVSAELDQPQIFYLFYSKYDPAKYLSEGGTVGGGFSEQNNRLANKFYFRGVDWFKDNQLPNTLLVAIPKEVPVEAKDHILARYDSLDKKPLAYFLWTDK